MSMQEAVAREVAYRAADVRRQWLAGDRRHPPLDRGDRGGDHPAVQRARGAGESGADDARPRLAKRVAPGDARRRGRAVRGGRPRRSTRMRSKAALLAAAVAPRDLADALAELKALKVSRLVPGALVLGSDSVVALDGRHAARQAARAARRPPTILRAMSRQARIDLCSAAVIAEGGRPVWRHVDRARAARAAAVRRVHRPLSRRRMAGDRGLRRLLPDRGAGRAAVRARSRASHFTVLGMPLLPVLGYLRERGRAAVMTQRPMPK